MSAAVTLAVVAVSLFVTLYTCWMLYEPFVTKPAPSAGRSTKALELATTKEQLLVALEDLEQDFRGEKIAESDYAASKQDLMSRAARCLLEIEALEKSVGDAGAHC